jgi:hypothetical protein
MEDLADDGSTDMNSAGITADATHKTHESLEKLSNQLDSSAVHLDGEVDTAIEQSTASDNSLYEATISSLNREKADL